MEGKDAKLPFEDGNVEPQTRKPPTPKGKGVGKRARRLPAVQGREGRPPSAQPAAAKAVDSPVRFRRAPQAAPSTDPPDSADASPGPGNSGGGGGAAESPQHPEEALPRPPPRRHDLKPKPTGIRSEHTLLGPRSPSPPDAAPASPPVRISMKGEPVTFSERLPVQLRLVQRARRTNPFLKRHVSEPEHQVRSPSPSPSPSPAQRERVGPSQAERSKRWAVLSLGHSERRFLLKPDGQQQ